MFNQKGYMFVCTNSCTLCMYVCMYMYVRPNTVEGNKNICDALSLASGTVLIELRVVSRWTSGGGRPIFACASPGQHWDL